MRLQLLQETALRFALCFLSVCLSVCLSVARLRWLRTGTSQEVHKFEFYGTLLLTILNCYIILRSKGFKHQGHWERKCKRSRSFGGKCRNCFSYISSWKMGWFTLHQAKHIEYNASVITTIRKHLCLSVFRFYEILLAPIRTGVTHRCVQQSVWRTPDGHPVGRLLYMCIHRSPTAQHYWWLVDHRAQQRAVVNPGRTWNT